MSGDIIHNEFPILRGEQSNFFTHRKTALRWIQMLSGKTWTDYNIHDPGVTILEILCYALTEIEYKLDFSIEDILRSSSRNPFDLSSNAFLLAENIMTTAPVTILDYRKLIIDNIKEINNAWLVPRDHKNESEGGYNQIYDVLILAKNPVLVTAAIKATENLLKNYRGYGTPEMHVKDAKFTYIPLHAEVHIDPLSNPEDILAQMFFNLNEALLNVNPNRQPFSELEEEGMGYDTIFDGPQMKNGIVANHNLFEPPSSINLSHLKKIMIATEGVEMINNIFIKKENNDITELKTSKQFMLKKGCIPYFAPGPNQIKTYKAQELVEINIHKIKDTISHMADKTSRDYLLKNQHKSASYIFKAKHRNVHNYYSIKHDFPNAYGLNEKGFSLIQNLESSKVAQLKDYLFPYEQILTNSFLRLAHLGKLFSVQDQYNTIEDDFHEQSAISEPNSQKMHNPFEQIEIPPSSDGFHQLCAGNDLNYLEQRNQILTHLLARFDVHIDDTFEMHHVEDETEHLKEIILGKEKFLQNINKITCNRSVFDISGAEDTSGKTSLENELYLRLGITNPPQRPLFKIFRYSKYSIEKITKKSIKIVDKSKGNKKKSQSFKIEWVKSFTSKENDKNVEFHSLHKNLLDELINLGSLKASYKLINTSKKKKHEVIIDNSGGTSVKLPGTEKPRDKVLKQVGSFIRTLKKISMESERFYLIDHALLETNDNEESFTYYRMSFIFASTSIRFQDPYFQKEAERIVAKLTPAHVRVDCIWLKLTSMKAFEKLYLKWQKDRSSTSYNQNLAKSKSELKKFLKKYF